MIEFERVAVARTATLTHGGSEWVTEADTITTASQNEHDTRGAYVVGAHTVRANRRRARRSMTSVHVDDRRLDGGDAHATDDRVIL